MMAGGKERLGSILDLPSGHGRVLRTLAAAFPDAKITACDIDHDCVDFCAKTFGAVAVYSRERPHQIPISGKFDLIWCGSLLTHLDAPLWSEFLLLFQTLLRPSGLLVFTTHGRRVARPLKSRSGYFVGLGEDAARGIVADWERTGFTYGDYAGQQGRGVSLSSPSWVCARVCEIGSLRLVNYTERGWYDYQDAVGCLQTND